MWGGSVPSVLTRLFPAGQIAAVGHAGTDTGFTPSGRGSFCLIVTQNAAQRQGPVLYRTVYIWFVFKPLRDYETLSV